MCVLILFDFLFVCMVVFVHLSFFDKIVILIVTWSVLFFVVFVCVCVSLCVFLCVCFVFVCVFMYLYVLVVVCMCFYLFVCVWVCLYVYVCVCMCMIKPNRLSSTIDGNVEFVHSQYSCILTIQVSTVWCFRLNY